MLQQLKKADIADLIAWRHERHQHPEISGEEAETAQSVVNMLASTNPHRVLTGLGGHGVAAVYDSGKPGPTVMFRSELDALPIQELGDALHRSLVPGKAHLCGHDGHSAILLGLARVLGRSRLERGRVVLMFQPAEEDGSGAAAVIADKRYDEIQPDYAFSLHNAPGLPLGEAFLSEGPANCASRGMRIQLHGSTAHAANPAAGRSPLRALATLLPGLESLSSGGELGPGFQLVTVTHASMGERVYGIAPGHAEIRATLRTVHDPEMSSLVQAAEALVRRAAAEYSLRHEIEYADVFLACSNDPLATELFRQGLDRSEVPYSPKPTPQRGSEDFGRFGHRARSAMLLLGAGTDCPAVHTPTYDFPDSLIEIGVRLFAGTLAVCSEHA